MGYRKKITSGMTTLEGGQAVSIPMQIELRQGNYCGMVTSNE